MPEGSRGWDETSTSYRYRIRSPDKFQEGTFRTIELENTKEETKKWVKDHPDVTKEVSEMEQITKAEWTASFINDLPDEAFAVIEPAYKKGETEDKRARHLPHHKPGVKDPNDDDSVDLPHLRNALARANQIKPITDSISAEELRQKAIAHLQAHAKRLGVGEQNKVQKTVGFKKADNYKRIVYGEVYVPYERDTDGNWMTPDEVEKMAHRFMENLRLTKIDKQHDGEPDEGVVVESFIARPGDPDFTPGAWVLGTKILKESTWQAILKGEITGYSIAGVAELIPEEGGDKE